jgi:steroid delta-isomerase-like uncharacterized protein
MASAAAERLSVRPLCGKGNNAKGDLPVITEENKSIANRFAQAWTAGCLHVVDELADPDIVVSYPIPPEPMRGRQQFKAFLTGLFAGLPDAEVTVDEMLAEGDKVACRWTMNGTHKGTLFDIPPTGRSVQISGFTFYRIADGKVIEETGMGNTFGLMQQLGAFDAPRKE